jgi:hypothetical protein
MQNIEGQYCLLGQRSALYEKRFEINSGRQEPDRRTSLLLPPSVAAPAELRSRARSAQRPPDSLPRNSPCNGRVCVPSPESRYLQ